MRILTATFLLLAVTLGAQARKQGGWASARERDLKGGVRTVVSTCSDVDGRYATTFKFEFARDGKLMVITAPQFPQYDCIISLPTSYKITRRNKRGDATEASFLVNGALEKKERNELEYDANGNWIKAVTYEMREYEMEGSPWKAGERQARTVCRRTIEYYR